MLDYPKRLPEATDAKALRARLIAAGVIVPHGDYVPIACDYSAPVLKLRGDEDCSPVEVERKRWSRE